MINGETIVVGLFGDPVRHSLSPSMHNAAFQERGLNFCYLPFHVHKEDLPGAVKAISSLRLRGVNVTAPHKESVVLYLNDLAAEASFLNAVNTIINDGERLTGHNTDVYGFLFLLKHNLGKDFPAEKACLLGAGGAARAVALALNRAGVKSLVIANRSAARAESLASFIIENNIFRESMVNVAKLDPKHLRENASDAAVIINALSEDPFELGILPQEGLDGCRAAIDLRYHAKETSFMKWAASGGIQAFNGLDMLLGQGIKAFELFTGTQAPVEIMRKALIKGLNRP